MQKISEDPPEIESHGICVPCKESLLADFKLTKAFDKLEMAREILGPDWFEKLTE